MTMFLVAVGAEYVSVVLEIRHVETVRGVSAERKIHIVLERIARRFVSQTANSSAALEDTVIFGE